MAEAKGVDVSSWQHPNGAAIDWEKVADSGITFALVKATQGVGYVNPWLARDLDDAAAAGLLVGAYHYAEAGSDGKAQGDHFVASLMGHQLALGCWVDWELEAIADYAVAGLYGPMSEAVAEARGSCGLYAGPEWVAKFAQLSVPYSRLWLADWTAETPSTPSTLWQYAQGTVPGIPWSVDLDVLRSTRGVDISTAPRPRPAGVPVDTRSDEERAAADLAAATAAEKAASVGEPKAGEGDLSGAEAAGKAASGDLAKAEAPT